MKLTFQIGLGLDRPIRAMKGQICITCTDLPQRFLRDSLWCHSEWHSKGAVIPLYLWWTDHGKENAEFMISPVYNTFSAWWLLRHDFEQEASRFLLKIIQKYMLSHTKPGIRPLAFRLVDDPRCILAEPRLIHETVSSKRQCHLISTDFFIGLSAAGHSVAPGLLITAGIY